METYLIRFQKMVEALENDPNVQITHFHTFPPATSEQIKNVESKLGYPLHSSIKSFYQQTNGLQLLWIFKSNEQFDPKIHFRNSKVLDFFHHYADYFPEEGSIMILPIEKAFLQDWNDQVYFDFMDNDEQQKFANQSYGLLDFHQRIKPFDCFNKYYDMAFLLDGSNNPPVILGDDHQACYTDSFCTTFESYLEFILANKGVISRRNDFYYKYEGHQEEKKLSPLPYFTKEKILDLSVLLLKDILPQCEKSGSSTIGLNTALVQQMAESSKPLTKTQMNYILKNHYAFLSSGGAGGKWQTVNVSGLVLGIYTGAKNNEGEQANFERKHLPPRITLTSIDFPFANFCGCYAKRVDFLGANLSHSLFTDSMLDGVNFGEANLAHVDFSRASLRNANFTNANLQNTDFENCDVTGAIFTGANLKGSRFPGAIVKEVKI